MALAASGNTFSSGASSALLNALWKFSNSSSVCRYVQSRRALSQESGNSMVGSRCQTYPLAAKRLRHSFRTVLFEYYAETIVQCLSM
ncbi:hypothetical protein CCHR01_12935 [Colletotrichum chrysophilum]|uniref:Uncharacterized protein n=1 Tax=Colletotrichum chrysophilum TaxID=1836956 RepID=A0AAD9EDN0_9PEZI|nr:hypothetical protein K456DRAFT_57994 [Colletotrichum gloeosporioides 23]KAK1844443.1 hypothetical protein CCHR01_12935 [Colletotrichum chrysophilum]